jgi:hypothetical protein
MADCGCPSYWSGAAAAAFAVFPPKTAAGRRNPSPFDYQGSEEQREFRLFFAVNRPMAANQATNHEQARTGSKSSSNSGETVKHGICSHDYGDFWGQGGGAATLLLLSSPSLDFHGTRTAQG